MDKVYKRCSGIDVRKKKIVACSKYGDQHEIRRFGTTTTKLRTPTAWLLDAQHQMVAMETVPGRKTDVKGAEWIADLISMVC